MSSVTCGYCGRGFAQDQGQPACAACPLRGGCRFLRCPHCGYENPVTPPWVARLKGLFGAQGAGPESGPATIVGEERRAS